MVILFGLWPLRGDLFMHLVVGRWTLEHGGPPRVDVFSYVTEGAPFLAHSWLGGTIFYLIGESAGMAGWMGLRCVLLSAAFTCALGTARLLGAS